MTVNLATKFTEIAALNVVINGGIVPVLGLADNKQRIGSADLPARVQLLLSAQRRGGAYRMDIDGVNVGRNTDTITELFLYKPLVHEIGIHDFDPTLVEFMHKFRRALITLDYFEITTVSMSPGPIEWPIGSTNWFAGVETQITIVSPIAFVT